jgi:hypothetical protein
MSVLSFLALASSRLQKEIVQFIYLIEGKDNAGNKVKAPSKYFVAGLQDDQASTRDNETQNKKYRVKKWLKGIVRVGAVVTVFLIFLQWRTQISSNEQDERAWVGVPSQFIVIDGLRVGPNGPIGTTFFPIKNFGKTPALSVMPIAMLHFKTKDLSQTSEHTCDALDEYIGIHHPNSMSVPEIFEYKWGQLLFPGTEYRFSIGLGANIDHSEPYTYIVGCVVYRDIFKKPHRTRFCYETTQPITEQPTSVMFSSCQSGNYTEEVYSPKIQ